MSSIPAAKERPSGIYAAKEAILAYATRLGNRSLYARQSVAILAELSRLEEQVATLTRERDEAFDVLAEASRVYDGMEDGTGDTCPTLIRIRATLSRQSKEGGE